MSQPLEVISYLRIPKERPRLKGGSESAEIVGVFISVLGRNMRARRVDVVGRISIRPERCENRSTLVAAEGRVRNSVKPQSGEMATAQGNSLGNGPDCELEALKGSDDYSAPLRGLWVLAASELRPLARA